jgi:hypothetical protein
MTMFPLVVALSCLFAPPAPATQVTMADLFLRQDLARFAKEDPAGLGTESASALAWATERANVTRKDTEPAVLRWRDETRPMSAELNLALTRMAQYRVASMRARSRPLGRERLVEALASERAAGVIAAVFEESIEQREETGTGFVFLELGGEAALTPHLELRPFRDPSRAVLRQVSEVREAPTRVGLLFEEQPLAMALLDPRGQLMAEVALFATRAERGLSRERRLPPFLRAVDTVLRNAADSFTLVPVQQLECIIAHDWEADLLGLWHVHPPALGPGRWIEGGAPSPDDREVAAATGQFLTIVFRVDGYDVHDLSARASSEAAGTVRYRSEDWRRRFETLRAAISD